MKNALFAIIMDTATIFLGCKIANSEKYWNKKDVVIFGETSATVIDAVKLARMNK